MVGQIVETEWCQTLVCLSFFKNNQVCLSLVDATVPTDSIQTVVILANSVKLLQPDLTSFKSDL